MRGRRPDSPNLTLLKRKKQGLPTGTITPLKGIKPPAWLSDEALVHWKGFAPELIKAGILTALDVVALGMACEEVALFFQMRKALQDAGSMVYTSDSGQEKPRPELGIMHASLGAFLNIGRDFGLTPLSRTRFRIPTGEGKENAFARFDDDEFDRL